MEETSKHGVLGRHQSCSKERIEVLSDAIERNTLPAYCIPKVVRMETEEIIFEKVYETPRLPPKISLRHDWMKELGPEVARQAEVNQHTQPTGSSTPFYEVDIDFRVSGLPHAVVKQAENSRVRELVKKIENHPHRQALQDNLQQNNAYNPFSEKSKKMIKGDGQCRAI